MPACLFRRKQHQARRIHIETVSDPAAKGALPHTQNLGVTGDDSVEHRSGLVFAQWMNRHPGGLVDGEPAVALGGDHQRAVRLGDRTLVVGLRERRHDDPIAGPDLNSLCTRANGSPSDVDNATREQPPGLGTRQAQTLRQKHVEALPGVVDRHFETARGFIHGPDTSVRRAPPNGRHADQGLRAAPIHNGPAGC